MGSVFWQAASGEPLDDVTFAGVTSDRDRKVHKRDEVFGRAVEKFLILHRNHDLVFAPEGVDDMLEDQVVLTHVDADELLDANVEPLPDTDAELGEWVQRLHKEHDDRFKHYLRKP